MILFLTINASQGCLQIQTLRNSVVQVPGKYEWCIDYHWFKIPDGNGYNRETCIAPMRFDANGFIVPVDVFEKTQPLKNDRK